MYNVYAECQMLSSVAPGKILSPDVLYFLPQPPVLPRQPLHTLDVPGKYIFVKQNIFRIFFKIFFLNFFLIEQK